MSVVILRSQLDNSTLVWSVGKAIEALWRMMSKEETDCYLVQKVCGFLWIGERNSSKKMVLEAAGVKKLPASLPWPLTCDESYADARHANKGNTSKRPYHAHYIAHSILPHSQEEISGCIGGISPHKQATPNEISSYQIHTRREPLCCVGDNYAGKVWIVSMQLLSEGRTGL